MENDPDRLARCPSPARERREAVVKRQQCPSPAGTLAALARLELAVLAVHTL